MLKPSPKELGTSATMISLSSLLPFLMSYEHDLSESGVFQSTFHIFSWLASQNLHSDSHGSRRPMLAVGGLHIESLRLDGHNQVLAKKARSAKGTTGYTSICVFHLIHTYIHTQTQIYIYITCIAYGINLSPLRRPTAPFRAPSCLAPNSFSKLGLAQNLPQTWSRSSVATVRRSARRNGPRALEQFCPPDWELFKCRNRH